MMKNETNIKKYRRLAPIYDLFFGAILSLGREKAFNFLDFHPGNSVLLVGVGTGEDLKYIPDPCSITGIDISDPMLDKAKRKSAGKRVKLINMNAEKLSFPNNTFDIIVLNLILSVAENPQKVMSEAQRVLKPDGRILVFDKFIHSGAKVSGLRKLINSITSSIGTDINRCFEDTLQGLPVNKLRDESLMFGGMYRAIMLENVSDFPNC